MEKDLRKEIVGKLEGNKKCPKCGSYNNTKIEGLKIHTGYYKWVSGNKNCQNCGYRSLGFFDELRDIGEEWILEKKS